MEEGNEVKGIATVKLISIYGVKNPSRSHPLKGHDMLNTPHGQKSPEGRRKLASFVCVGMCVCV